MNQIGLVAKSVLFSVLVVLFFVVQGCAGKEFTPMSSGIVVQGPNGGTLGDPAGGGGTTSGTNGTAGIPGSGNPPGTTGSGTPGTTGSGTPTGGAPGSASDPLPKLTIQEPLCSPNMDCPAYFTLTVPAAKVLTFTWRTNDTLYSSDPSRIGQPNVHYVPTSGSVTFQVGDKQKPIFVHSLNITNSIVIPFIYSNCVWGGTPISCALLPQ